jgi:MFS family permease
MVAVAVGWQIYEITGSAFALGMIGFVQFIPTFTLVLFSGHVSDRWDRRYVTSICQAIEGVATFAIVAAILLHLITATWLFGMTLAIGIARAFEAPALTAMLPNLVPRETLQRALASSTSALKVAQMTGPALGGVLYALSPVAVYVSAATLVLAAAVMVLLTRPQQQVIVRTPTTLASLMAGVTFVVNDRYILGAISLDLFAVMMGGATALLPIYARDILLTGPWGLGLLRAAPAAGAIIMTVWLARVPLRRHVGPALFGSVAAFGIATIAFAISRSFWLSFFMLATSGLFDAISQVIRATLVQLETPDEVRGRVTAVNSMFTNSSGQLGQVESGLVAAAFGAVASAVIGGVGCIVIALAWMGMFPEIARIDTLEGRPAKEQHAS